MTIFFEKMTKGRLKSPNADGILVLPIAHYAAIKLPSNIKFYAIYGLGSCIALILHDKKKGISGMSHILLPRSNGKPNIEYPHKFVDLSLFYLKKELINLGASNKNIEAIVIGGSNIFRSPQNGIGMENIRAIEEELAKYKIPIEKKDLGGIKGRVVLYDINKFEVSIRFTGKAYSN